MEGFSPFETIPFELICSIFDRMNFPSKTESRLVCQSWRHLIDRFFVKARITLSNETYPFVRNCSLETSTLKVRDFSMDCSSEPKTLSRSKLAKLAKHLIFSPSSPPPTSAFSASSDDDHDNFYHFVQENMSRILLLNPTIESLVFEENSLKNIKSISVRGELFTKLTCLSVDFSYATDQRVFQDFTELKLPALKSVQLSEYWSEYGPETGLGYVGMYRFLANHKATLKYATVVHPMRNQDLRSANDEVFPPSKLETLKQDLSEIKLLSLYLYLVSIEGSGNFTLGGHLLQSQKSLLKLQVAIGGNYFYALPKIKDAISANSSTLEYLSILSHEQWGVYVNLSNTLTSLPECSKLESFEVDHFFIPSLPSLPPSIKSLSISGYLLSDRILHQLDEKLVSLEQLSYTDLSSYPYGTQEDVAHFQRIMALPKLKRIRICKQHLSLEFQDFLEDCGGITWSEVAAEVTFRDNFLPYYEILTDQQRAANNVPPGSSSSV